MEERKIIFKTLKAARLGQKKFKNNYGYRPSLFRMESKLFIINPRGLIKIRSIK